MPETNSNVINFFDWLENKFKKEFVEPLKEKKKCDIISIKDYKERQLNYEKRNYLYCR